jgi:predicted MPP superfamily phosphohydrolase
MIGGFALRLARVSQFVPPGSWVPWLQAAALGWALSFFTIFAGLWLWRRSPRFDPERRKWLKIASGAAVAAPVAVGGYGAFVERSSLAANQIDLRLDGLPAGLDGLRLAQLTDIHLSPFLSVRDLSRAVSMANEFRPHIALVTGDLITSPGNWVDRCLKGLAQLRPSDGIYGCLGNHEVYARAEDYCAAEGPRYGIEFLRGEARSLSFRGAMLNMAGVDYQRLGEPYLRGAERLVRKGEFNMLLSHNPDVFPVAADMGFELTISGHTHGGQLALNLLGYSLNVVRFFTPYVRGLYRRGRAAVYVCRGIGTVGVPVRIGAPPEVALIRLCAT